MYCNTEALTFNIASLLKRQIMKILMFLKPLFIFLLTFLFAYIFGYPSLKRFLEKAVVIQEDMEKNDEVKAPAITFCVEFPQSWKNTTIEMNAEKLMNLFGESCPSKELDCIEEKTYSKDELIINANQNLFNKTDISKSKFWNSDMTRTLFGMCHSFQYPESVGNVDFKDEFGFELNPNVPYRIFMHDPNFFILSNNQVFIPHIDISLR